jgi:3-deoxy-7-phosphoheptulonate synthase
VSNRAAQTTYAARQAIHRILHGADDRLLVVIGPCSIHDYDAAMEYAKKLAKEAEKHGRPRHRDARLFRKAAHHGRLEGPDQRSASRQQLPHQRRPAPGARILLEINELGLPCATEFLDTITPQYTADLIAWGAIGARTTESQVHRELASGLSCPVGFKNGTDGNMRIAVDAIRSANSPHHFLSVTKSGHSAIVSTTGNEDCHVILRGGKEPNFDAASVDAACSEIAKAGLAARLMVDFSHGNSRKQYKLQMEVRQRCAQLAAAKIASSASWSSRIWSKAARISRRISR